MLKDLEICILLDIYGELITKKQYEVLDYYYNQDLSLAEISEHLGITRQGVRDSIKNGREQLLYYEEKLKLRERFNKDTEKINTINELIENIIRLNSVQLRNNLLHEWITKIHEIINSNNY